MPLGEQFKPWYPGLIPVAAELWRAWLREHEGEFQAFEYNVRVGQGLAFELPVQPGDDPAITARVQQNQRESTQKRIDVVGHKGDVTWIIELDERPGPRALGQLLTYRLLLTKQRDLTGPIELVLICKRIGPDMLEAFDDQGVVVYQHPEPGVFTATRLI